MTIYTYQNFLNALDFSVQIVIHSRKLNSCLPNLSSPRESGGTNDRGVSRQARGVSFNPNPSANFVGSEGDKLWRSLLRMFETTASPVVFCLFGDCTSSPPFRLVISSRRRLRGEITFF